MIVILRGKTTKGTKVATLLPGLHRLEEWRKNPMIPVGSFS